MAFISNTYILHQGSTYTPGPCNAVNGATLSRIFVFLKNAVDPLSPFQSRHMKFLTRLPYW